jgi:hypothetical protein
VYQAVTGLTQGQTYTASVWAQSQGGGQIDVYDQGGGSHLCIAGLTANWGTWQQFSCTATVDSTGKLVVALEGGSSTSGGQVWDDVALQAGGAATLFSTGLESGQTQPTWSDTVDFSSNVGGICCSLTGPELGVRSGEQAHTGSSALMYSGMANGGSTTYAYLKSFDLSGAPPTIDASTVLDYWIYPQSSSSSSYVSGSNSTCVAIDMLLSDGSWLRNDGVKDQNGNQVHPAGQCNHLTLDTWNHVIASMGSLAGKKIQRIDVGWDDVGATGGYRGYVDDITISG